MSEWRPIESAPRDGERVVLFRRWYAERMAICYWARDWGEWLNAGTDTSFVNPTHWMPLPPPPTTNDKEPTP